MREESATGSHFKGAKKRYAYYLCPRKGCLHYGKSIPRDRLEDEFEELLSSLKPSPKLFVVLIGSGEGLRRVRRSVPAAGQRRDVFAGLPRGASQATQREVSREPSGAA